MTERVPPSSPSPNAKSRGTPDNAVQLRHVEAARVPLRHAAPSPPQLPDSIHQFAEKQSYRPHQFADTHKKVGSEIEVGDVRKTDGGRELRGGGGKTVDEVFPGRLQSFRYQRQPVDERAWRMTA